VISANLNILGINSYFIVHIRYDDDIINKMPSTLLANLSKYYIDRTTPIVLVVNQESSK